MAIRQPQPHQVTVLKSDKDRAKRQKELVEDGYELFDTAGGRLRFRKPYAAVFNASPEAVAEAYDFQRGEFVVDLAAVKGSGKDGAIGVDDVRKALGRA